MQKEYVKIQKCINENGQDSKRVVYVTIPSSNAHLLAGFGQDKKDYKNVTSVDPQMEIATQDIVRAVNINKSW